MRPCGSIGVVCVAVALLGGCAVQIPKHAKKIQPPSIEALPIAVGVHYPEAFKNATNLQGRWSGPTAFLDRSFDQAITKWEYPYGAQSVASLEVTFQSLFESIVPVEAWPPPKSPGLPRVSAVMVPRLVDVAIFSRGAFSKGGRFSVFVTYVIELYTPEGQLVETWKVKSEPKTAKDAYLDLGDAIDSAITDAITQFILDFLKRKEQIRDQLSVPAVKPKDSF